LTKLQTRHPGGLRRRSTCHPRARPLPLPDACSNPDPRQGDERRGADCGSARMPPRVARLFRTEPPRGAPS